MQQHIQELLFVITSAIKDQVYQGPILDEQSFFVAAYENGLIGLIHGYLSKENISEKLYNRLSTAKYAYIASDVMQLQVIEKLKNLFNESQIKHIFLKGSHLKFIYPHTYMRGMGDIDVLVEKTQMKKVHELFLSEKIHLESRSTRHVVYKTTDNISIEIHPALYKNSDIDFQDENMDPWLHAKLEKLNTYTLSPTYELVYLLYHLSNHVETSGIGLRSILDIGVYLKAYQDIIEFDKLEALLSLSKLTVFFNVLALMNERYFGFTFNFDFNRKLLEDHKTEALLDFFTKSGIHGKGQSFNVFESRMASHQKNNKSSVSFYFSLFFPHYREMKVTYPILKVIPILLPFAWIYRLVIKVLKNFSGSIIKLKKALKNKDSLGDIQSLLDDLGL